MRIISIAIVALLLAASAVLAQQDPNDPGLPDSIIVDAFSLDSGAVMASARIWVVTDDSVAFYNFPLAWYAPRGGIQPMGGSLYFPPITSWDDRYDSVCTADHFVRQLGFADLDSDTNPPLMTNEQRVNCWTLRFSIAPGVPTQVVTLDTIYDNINGSLMLGLFDGVTEFRPIFRGDSFYVLGTGIYENAPTPGRFELLQNYPNPFNAQTLIQYNLPGESDVSLTIFDILGRQVETLIDGYQTAGPHQVIWNADNSPSGIYFYRLKARDVIETKRMLLIR
jgi:hypothetical protein